MQRGLVLTVPCTLDMQHCTTRQHLFHWSRSVTIKQPWPRYIRYLITKQTVTLLPTTPENVTTLPCKMHNFFYFFHLFTHISSTNSWYGRVPEASCCDIGWNSAERVDDAVDHWWKRLEACIRAEGGHFEHLLQCCLSDIPFVAHHSQFFAEPPMPTHNWLISNSPTFGETHIPSVIWKSCAFYKVLWWRLQVHWVRGQA